MTCCSAAAAGPQRALKRKQTHVSAGRSKCKQDKEILLRVGSGLINLTAGFGKPNCWFWFGNLTGTESEKKQHSWSVLEPPSRPFKVAPVKLALV